MKEIICKAVSEILEQSGLEGGANVTIETPPDSKMGDVAIPCFGLAKILHKSPVKIAADLKEGLEQKKDMLGLDKIVADGG